MEFMQSLDLLSAKGRSMAAGSKTSEAKLAVPTPQEGNYSMSSELSHKTWS